MFSVTVKMWETFGVFVRHLNIIIGEHIGILPLTKKQVKARTAL